MFSVNIAEAKLHLSRYLARVKSGETIIICERNVPIAELRPLGMPSRQERSLEPIWPEWSVPDTFFEPLPEEDVHGSFEVGS